MVAQCAAVGALRHDNAKAERLELVGCHRTLFRIQDDLTGWHAPKMSHTACSIACVIPIPLRVGQLAKAWQAPRAGSAIGFTANVTCAVRRAGQQRKRFAAGGFAVWLTCSSETKPGCLYRSSASGDQLDRTHVVDMIVDIQIRITDLVNMMQAHIVARQPGQRAQTALRGRCAGTARLREMRSDAQCGESPGRALPT